MKLLTIDASTSQTGWAYWDNEKLIEYDAIIPPKYVSDYIDKIELMADSIKLLIEQFEINTVLLK